MNFAEEILLYNFLHGKIYNMDTELSTTSNLFV